MSERLKKFAEEFLKVNASINLMSKRTDKDLLYNMHIADSIELLKHINFEKGDKMLDIGAGGGFPSMPIAIERPDIEVYLLDSTAKKLNAIKDIANKLDISNVRFIIDRAEDAAHSDGLREKFDIVTARAVGPTSVILEYGVPFLKVGGIFVAYKSNDEDCGGEAPAILNCSLERVIPYELPNNCGMRTLLIFRKDARCDDRYPRAVGVPVKNPL